MAAISRIRLTQEQRRTETRKRLLDATVQCLIERGYAKTTTKEIAQRAGYTRGAQLHHFGRKEDLVLQAVEHLFELRMAELIEKLMGAPRAEDENEIALRDTWDIMKSPFFIAFIELLVAGRTDERLRSQLQEVGKRFDDKLEEIRRQFSTSSRAEYVLLQDFVVTAMAGRVLLSLANDAEHPRWVSEESMLGVLRVSHQYLAANPALIEKYAPKSLPES